MLLCETCRGHIDELNIEHGDIFRSQIDIIRVLLRVGRVNSVLELGTFFGYSTLVFADHVSSCKPSGRVVTVDKDQWRVKEARTLIEPTGLAGLLILGLAMR